jgi:hypothetical protein
MRRSTLWCTETAPPQSLSSSGSISVLLPLRTPARVLQLRCANAAESFSSVTSYSNIALTSTQGRPVEIRRDRGALDRIQVSDLMALLVVKAR